MFQFSHSGTFFFFYHIMTGKAFLLIKNNKKASRKNLLHKYKDQDGVLILTKSIKMLYLAFTYFELA